MRRNQRAGAAPQAASQRLHHQFKLLIRRVDQLDPFIPLQAKNPCRYFFSRVAQVDLEAQEVQRSELDCTFACNLAETDQEIEDRRLNPNTTHISDVASILLVFLHSTHQHAKNCLVLQLAGNIHVHDTAHVLTLNTLFGAHADKVFDLLWHRLELLQLFGTLEQSVAVKDELEAHLMLEGIRAIAQLAFLTVSNLYKGLNLTCLRFLKQEFEFLTIRCITSCLEQFLQVCGRRLTLEERVQHVNLGHGECSPLGALLDGADEDSI